MREPLRVPSAKRAEATYIEPALPNDWESPRRNRATQFNEADFQFLVSGWAGRQRRLSASRHLLG